MKTQQEIGDTTMYYVTIDSAGTVETAEEFAEYLNGHGIEAEAVEAALNRVDPEVQDEVNELWERFCVEAE